MDYRPLGRSGLKVSPLCLGAMMFGDRTDYAEAVAHRGLRPGRRRELHRHRRVVRQGRERRRSSASSSPPTATTGCSPPRRAIPSATGPTRAAPAGSACCRPSTRAWTAWARTTWTSTTCTRTSPTSRSRRRSAPWATSSPRARRATSASPTSAAGASRRPSASAGELGVAKPVVCQPYYNAMNRQPETEVLPACHHHGIGVATYSPLARGVLVGKYAPGEAPPQDTRAGRKDRRMMQTEFRRRVAGDGAGAQGPRREAGDHRHRVRGELGARQSHRHERHRGAAHARAVGRLSHRLGKPWDEGDEALVDSLVRPGHPSTPGYNDPAYPLTGRLAG